MKLRPRTLRRLGAFLVVVALLAAGAWVVEERGARRQERRLLEQRRQGLESIATGDYPAALSALGAYLSEAEPQRVERDLDARLAYAEARARIYDTGERHLEQAGRMLRDLADDFPEHPRRLEALHLLMDVAAAGNEWQELRRLCDETLDQHPLDRQTLRMRREAAEQLGDYSSALADTQRLIVLDPTDIDEQIWTLRLMARLGQTPEEIVSHAIDLASRNAQDPRYLLVLAAAYRHAGQTQQALACLNQAAQFDPPSEDPAAFVTRLAGLFDTFGEHTQAATLYANALARLPAEEPSRDWLRQLLAIRLWQSGRLEEALEVVPAPTTEHRRRNVGPYAIRILLQFERGDTAQAEQGLASLGRIAETLALNSLEKRRATAWYEALRAAYAPGRLNTRQRLEALHAAYARIADLREFEGMVASDRPPGLFVKWAGDRCAELGETEEAISHWRRAASALPGWDEPLLRVAEALAATGLFEEADSAAEGALARAQEIDDRPRVLLAQVAYQRWLAAPSTAGAEHAAALAEAHQRLHPLHPGTLPAHVHMTSLTDRQEARQLVRQRLERGAEASVRVELARVSMLAELDLEQELLADVMDPDAALLRAQSVAASGDTERALAIMEPPAQASMRVTTPASSSLTKWQLARARFLSHIGSPEAASTWRRLGALQVDDVSVQLAILDQLDLLAREPMFAAETVERLAQLTGPNGRRWRQEKARWLLARGTPEAALDAADLLRVLIRQSGGGADSVNQRVLLAEAMIIAGNVPVALEHFRDAYALDPTRGDVGLRLIALYEHMGRRDEARRLLGQLASEGVRGSGHRMEIAQRLARFTEMSTAIGLLVQSDAAGQLNGSDKAFLAELLHKDGRSEEAGERFERLLDRDRVPPAAALSAATFYMLTGNPARAQGVLSALDRSVDSEVDRDVLRGTIRARVGDALGARAAFASALQKRPEYADPWREAAGLEAGCSNGESTLQILRQAADAGIIDDHLEALLVQGEALTATTGKERYVQLEALAAAVRSRKATADWLQLADALSSAAATLRDSRPLNNGLLARLERAAEYFTYFEALHFTLAEAYHVQRMPLERARIATTFAEAAPCDAAAQRLAFEASRDAGAYSQAEFYAARWQQLTESDSLWADVAVSEARLLAGNYKGASQALAEHADRSSDNPLELARLLALSAEAQAAVGEYVTSFTLVAPHLADSPTWRSVAIRAARRISDPSEAVRWLREVETVLDEAHSASSNLGTSSTVQSLAEERLLLASAWTQLGIRFKQRTLLERGRRQLEQLTLGPLAQSADAWEALAQAEDAAAARPQAELAYRRVLALDPRRASAANQLARLLIASDDPIAQAESLTWARIAAEQDPIEPSYHATLARACQATRLVNDAQRAFERSLRLCDEHLDAMLGLARILLQAGETETALRWYLRVRPIYTASVPVEPELQADFAALTQRFAR